MRAKTRFISVLSAICLVVSSASPLSAVDGEPGLAFPTVAPLDSMGNGGDTIWPAYSGCGGMSAPAVNEAYEQMVVEIVNDARATQNPPLPPLKRATGLGDAARYHAADMGQDDYFDHYTKDRNDGNLSDVCSWTSRLNSYYDGPWLGENIAAGQLTPQEVMSTWLASTKHRPNILSSTYREIGVGYYEGSGTYVRYWVQDFGKREDVYPLIINGDAATTDSSAVQLYIYGDWLDMRLRNDNGPWSAWQAFHATSSWTLGSGIGDHTVFVELRNGTRAASSSDAIYLTTDGAALGSLPDSVGFLYSIPDQRPVPAVASFPVLNTGSSTPLSWAVTVSGTWFTVTPTQGTSPGVFRITPDSFGADTAATYTGAVTVTATGAGPVDGSPHRIDLGLRVVDLPIRSLFLPVILKSASQ